MQSRFRLRHEQRFWQEFEQKHNRKANTATKGVRWDILMITSPYFGTAGEETRGSKNTLEEKLFSVFCV